MWPLLAALLVLLTFTACGGDGGRLDHEETCTEVAKAWPGDLYIDESNAAFAKELGRILKRAEPEVREAFDDVVTHMGLVVAAAGDNTAVLTESVEVRAALQDVNAACEDADAPTIG